MKLETKTMAWNVSKIPLTQCCFNENMKWGRIRVSAILSNHTHTRSVAHIQRDVERETHRERHAIEMQKVIDFVWIKWTSTWIPPLATHLFAYDYCGAIHNISFIDCDCNAVEWQMANETENDTLRLIRYLCVRIYHRWKLHLQCCLSQYFQWNNL